MKRYVLIALMLIVFSVFSFAKGVQEETPEEPVVVTIMCVENYYAPAPYSTGLPVIEAFREKCEEAVGLPIEFEFITYTWSNFDEMRDITLASGQDLPWFIWNVQEDQKWGEPGVLIDMLPYIEKYAPNMVKEMEDRPILKAISLTPDGKMYKYAMVSYPQFINGGGVTIRKDWLDKFGLSVPTTTAEWLNAVKTFRDKDANGDGKSNEIVTLSQNTMHLTMGAWFGLQTWRSAGFQVDEKGTVEYAWITPRAKEYVQFVRELYTEDILDPDFMNLNRELIANRLNSNLVGSVIGYFGTAPGYNETYDPAPGAELVNCPVLIGPHGDQYMELAPGVDIPQSISRDADPIIAIKILDVARSPWGGINNTFGIEGLTYEIKDGKKVWTELLTNNPDGLSRGQTMNSLGMVRNFLRGHSYESWEMNWNTVYAPMKAGIPYHRVDIPFVEGLTMDLEDLPIISRHMPDIQTYVDENIIKFMIGEQSMALWDGFVDRVESLGIDKVVAVRQKQADRFIGIVGDNYPWKPIKAW